MPIYLWRGELPDKRHIQLRDNKGHLFHEEHVSREGFSSVYSNVYHYRAPTRIAKVGEFEKINYHPAQIKEHRHHHFETAKFEPSGNWLSGRRLLMYNNDVALFSCVTNKESNMFYRNGFADEVIFIHEGEGELLSMFGRLSYKPGDYIIIPRGIMFRMKTGSDTNRFLIIESGGMIETPKRYRNAYGQHLEHAPFCERDFLVPEFVEPVNEEGEFPMLLKTAQGIQQYVLAQHPFDLVGWDGYYYPWIFNIRDFMPIVGKIHQPPPVHQTFEAPGFVICSFCPRLFDFHEKSIPAPYNHSNVDSDEVLYYWEGDFMSRKGVNQGSITLHPYGIPHGPQPGRYEGSIGKAKTDEYAVMLDTFRPLTVADDAMKVDDPHYPYSWIE